MGEAGNADPRAWYGPDDPCASLKRSTGRNDVIHQQNMTVTQFVLVRDVEFSFHILPPFYPVFICLRLCFLYPG